MFISAVSYKHDICSVEVNRGANFKHIFLSGTLTPEVRDNGDGTYDVTYVPPSEGSNLKAKITWDGKDIPNRYEWIYIN